MGKQLDFDKESKRSIIRQRGFEAVEPGDTTLTRGGFFRSDESGVADENYHGPEPTCGPRKLIKPRKTRVAPVAACKEPDRLAPGQLTHVEASTKVVVPKTSPGKKLKQRSKARISLKALEPQPTASGMPKIVHQSMPRGRTRSVIVEAKPLSPSVRNRNHKK